MSRIFPFMINSTPPEKLFTAIIQKSKDVPSNKIANIFNVILALGIEHVRDTVKNKLPDQPSTSDIFNKICETYPQYALSPKILDFFIDFAHTAANENFIKIKIENLSLIEKGIFMACWYQTKRELEYFIKLSVTDKCYEFINNIFSGSTIFLEFLDPEISFSEEGENHYFQDFSEFSAYLFIQLLKNQNNSTNDCKCIINPKKSYEDEKYEFDNIPF